MEFGDAGQGKVREAALKQNGKLCAWWKLRPLNKRSGGSMYDCLGCESAALIRIHMEKARLYYTTWMCLTIESARGKTKLLEAHFLYVHYSSTRTSDGYDLRWVKNT